MYIYIHTYIYIYIYIYIFVYNIKLISLSLNKIKLFAKSRGIKDDEDKSENYLIKILCKPEPKIKFSKQRIKKSEKNLMNQKIF